MKLKSLVLAVLVAALVLVVLAPAAAAGTTGVSIKLKGPSHVADGSAIELTATIKDSLKYGGGSRVAVLLQNKNGHLRRIASKTVAWEVGGSIGFVIFKHIYPTPTAMGIAAYRVAWRNPAGVTRSNVWRVEID